MISTDLPRLRNKLVVFGLIVQTVMFELFVVMAVIFHARMSRGGGAGLDWCSLETFGGDFIYLRLFFVELAIYGAVRISGRGVCDGK